MQCIFLREGPYVPEIRKQMRRVFQKLSPSLSFHIDTVCHQMRALSRSAMSHITKIQSHDSGTHHRAALKNRTRYLLLPCDGFSSHSVLLQQQQHRPVAPPSAPAPPPPLLPRTALGLRHYLPPPPPSLFRHRSNRKQNMRSHQP
jgi:hypothetical protein